MIRRRLAFRLGRRRILRGLPLALAALAFAPAALAGVQLVAVDTSAFPAVRATLIAPTGSQPPHLRENGLPVSGYTAVNLGREKAIVLALDRSQSMRGRPLQHAIAAARSFVAAAGRRDHVGLVAFGHSAFALGPFTDTPGEATSSLAGISVDTHAGTALYDAIALAASNLAGDDRPGRAIVVVTDGRDVSSTNTLESAIAAARNAHAAVYPIGIGGPSFTPDALRQIAHATGGSYRQVAHASDLGSVYGSLAGELARTWQLSYATAARPGAIVHLTAIISNAGKARASATIEGSSAEPANASPLIPSLGYTFGGTIAVSIVVGALVLLSCCFWFASQRGGQLRARIEPHLGTTAGTGKARRQKDRAAARTRIADGVESAFGDLRQFKRVHLMIERADLPLRAGELLALCAGLATFFGLVMAVGASPPLMILLVMALAFVIPLGYVSVKATLRLRRFENQLPDILITIAASLKAGHSFRQGIQSVVDEGSEPAAKEFRRVLTETQLGKTMDDALADFAGRIGSKNLTFVINAVTIQRQIGGSLAGLFDMVADTVRQRQQFARKVKGLTAMGRMSAYVLVGLPFFVGIVVTMMNPDYMSPLYHTPTGEKVLGSGLVMIVIGTAMLKKTISFKG
jgi:tight adherence protein B